jgi:hypothetical protein
MTGTGNPAVLSDLPRIIEIMRRYADLPADLADASIVRFLNGPGRHSLQLWTSISTSIARASARRSPMYFFTGRQ